MNRIVDLEYELIYIASNIFYMKPRTLLIAMLSLLLTVGTAGFSQPKSQPSLSGLTQGQLLDGFKVQSLYLNDRNQPMGARFIHAKTGFTLDLLQIESVPQAFLWVNTFPVSNMGEPHTQEHLLITKGNKGHELNTREGMSLAESNAFTEQLHTVYNFFTGAGSEVFYTLFDKYLDALLYPDYKDEEVRREVRNWGVSMNSDKTLKLEEKGTVYNEMSTSMNNPSYLIYNELNHVLYGNHHPLSYNAGGSPAGIRELTPAAIAAYHKANYYLGNMGAITSLPKRMSLGSVLQRMNGILLSLDKRGQHHAAVAKALPAPQPAQSGEIKVVKVPLEDVHQPGTMILAYPADLKLGVTDNLELSYFMETFAGNATTNLYQLLVNSKTHIPGFSAQGLYSSVDNNQGNPISIGLDGVKPEDLTPEKAGMVRNVILNELKKIAAWPDHSPELLEFNKRYLIAMTADEKSFNKFVNTPPQFGFRNTGDNWYQQLDLLKLEPGFKKSIVFKPNNEAIRQKLADGVNIWRTVLAKYGLLTKKPYIVYTQADPEMAKKAEQERLARVNTELARLKQQYKTNNDQEAIAAYQKTYDEHTAELEKLEQGHHISFIKNPPLTLDAELNYHQYTLNDHIPVVASVFDNMSSATAGAAFDLHSVPTDKLFYLSTLPQLLTGTGIIRNGQAISYSDMLQEIQQQILALNSYCTTNANTGRVELVVRGAGSNSGESVKAVEWMAAVLEHPNWTSNNLPRMRDLLEQQWAGVRCTMQQPEEYWVTDPGRAYLAQDQPLLLSAASFMTRTYNIFRLKWMLKEQPTGAADKTLLKDFLAALKDQSGNRANLKTLLSDINSGKSDFVTYKQLDAIGKKLAAEAASDLVQLLNDVPDDALAADWKMLCSTIQNSLAQGPDKTLAELNELRTSLLKGAAARIFLIGSGTTTQQLSDRLAAVLKGFDRQAGKAVAYNKARLVDKRLMDRLHSDAKPVYVGLINPNATTGVFMNSAPLTSYRDTTKQQLLQFLAAELYGGAGKESVYTKSTGAGLSYSTGVGASPSSGRFQYYAERTPELPQTLGFVINEIKKSPVDPQVSDYVIAEGIGNVRSASAYESRGEAMANDIADGQTDALVRNFRQAIVNLRTDPKLVQEIYAQKDKVYEKILPGYGKSVSNQAGGVYFVIGPEKQMSAYEAYLKRADGPSATLYRLYPRDFWITE